MRMIHLIDIQFLTKAMKALSSITGLNFSLYDDRENLLIAPFREDPLLSSIRTDKKGQELYNGFLSKYLKLTLKNTKSFLIQGFTMQYHVFIPIRYKEIMLVALCDGFYMSEEDFARFYATKADKFGLTNRTMEQWRAELKVVDSQTIENYIRSIKLLLENIISSGYEKGELNKRWQWSKTIISLTANIKSDATIEDVRQIIVDTVIFLFNIDTAAIFTRNKDFFCPESVGGRNRDIIRRLRLSKDNYLVSNAVSSRIPVSAIDSYKLKHSGFPEEIISMYLFPIYSQIGFFGFLGVFNSLLDREAFDSVNELCKLSAYLFGVRYLREQYEKHSDGLNVITRKTVQLFPHYKDQQVLCDHIVAEAAALVDAEKCSVMLPDDDGDSLSVISVKGLNKWLMKEVKIRVGEGIAGRVFQQGVPILIDNEEKLKTFSGTPKPLFKTQSCISLPLKISGETMGILNVSDKASGEPFTEKDLTVLMPFAMQSSILLKLSSCHRTSEQMRELSITDPLTGLFNRRYFDVRLEEEYQRAKRYGLNFSLAILDIDDFKALNDTEGHLAGDYALREIANIMTNSIRANDILVRIGGEEFAIIMPQTTKDEAFTVLERIRGNVCAMVLPGVKTKETGGCLTISTGIAMYPESGDSMENIIIQADKSLYSAKTSGKNRTVSWSPSVAVKPSFMKEQGGFNRGQGDFGDGRSSPGAAPPDMNPPDMKMDMKIDMKVSETGQGEDENSGNGRTSVELPEEPFDGFTI